LDTLQIILMAILLFIPACSWKTDADSSKPSVSTDTVAVDTDELNTTVDEDSATDSTTDSESISDTVTSHSDTNKTKDTGIVIEGQLSTGTYSTVAAAWGHTMAITSGGVLNCWGETCPTSKKWPTEELSKICTGSPVTCGLTKKDGRVICWSKSEYDLYGVVEKTPTDDGFSDLSCNGDRYGCAVHTAGSISCWGVDDGSSYDAGIVTNTPKESNFTDIATGIYHACALNQAGDIICWGNDVVDGRTYKPDQIADIIAGSSYTCVLRDDGGVECWGENSSVTNSVTDDTFLSIDSGPSAVCGITSEYKVRCWGTDAEDFPSTSSPSYVSVAVSVGHVCAIRDDQRVECWGNDNYGQSSPP